MSGIGGYVRRSDRKPMASEKEWLSTHCRYCGANMVHSAFPHFCKEITYQSMPILKFESFDHEEV